MSFTVIYNKGGVPTPIKLSIWDALKGSPGPKPLGPRTCNCCKKIHPAGKPSEDKFNKKESQGNDKKEQEGEKAESKDKKEARNFSTRERETYTEADDQTIIKMKESKKQWKQILEVINKTSESQLKAHWKEINPAGQGNKDGNKDNKKSDSNDDKNSTQKVEGQARKNQRHEGAEKKGSSKKEANSAELKNWSERYDRRKWIAAASRHFDLTGERITPAAARALAG